MCNKLIWYCNCKAAAAPKVKRANNEAMPKKKGERRQSHGKRSNQSICAALGKYKKGIERTKAVRRTPGAHIHDLGSMSLAARTDGDILRMDNAAAGIMI